MMFLPIFLMMIAGAGIVYLWDEVKRDEASEKYRKEVEAIRAAREREVIYPDFRRERTYRGSNRGGSRRCC